MRKHEDSEIRKIPQGTLSASGTPQGGLSCYAIHLLHLVFKHGDSRAVTLPAELLRNGVRSCILT